MTGPVSRNSVVFLLGTPQKVEGSLNDPVEWEEAGIHYNEKWIYSNLHDDPAGVPHRAIYWYRYDFVATVVRATEAEAWRPDTTLLEAAKTADPRLATVADHHSTYAGNTRYREVSRTRDSDDLGGYIQDEATGRPVVRTGS
jgi:hypothetical protein